MVKKHAKITQELELENVDGYTEAQKKYYSSLGFKPYLTENGRIKWLRPDQHLLRINSHLRRSRSARLFHRKNVHFPHRRRHRPAIVKLIQRNWLFILIVIIGLLAVVLVLLNPQIIF